MLKNLFIAVVGIVVAFVLYVSVTAFSPIEPAVQGPVACTLEAKICPDGTAVGRVGPNCEFAACPAPKPVVFECSGNRSIVATFHAESVDVVLSDGRSLSLRLGLVQNEDDGTKYLNDENGVIFWTKDQGAFITEGAEHATTFAACRAAL